MINRLALPLFIIGILLILVSFSNSFQANIQSRKNVQILNSPIPSLIPSSIPDIATSVTITKVVDGDTVDVDINGQRDIVRLIGINSPEVNQCFYREATNKAREVLQGKSVKLEVDSTQDNRDVYNRILRYIFLSDGTNFGELMIKGGFAKEYTFKVAYKYQSLYRQDEYQAKNNKIGLWADNPCPALNSERED